MVDYLLKSGLVDSKKPDIFGNTAIHHAATYGHDQVVILYFLCSCYGV